jgi:hypothetical protein
MISPSRALPSSALFALWFSQLSHPLRARQLCARWIFTARHCGIFFQFIVFDPFTS